MERKQKIEISIAVVIVLAFICILVWIFYKGDEVITAPEVDDQGEVIIDGQVVPSLDYSAYPESASTIARVFVERFGSFSNEAGYENVDSVMDIATAGLKQRLLDIMENASDDDSDVYYGISTHVLSVNQVSSTDEQEVYEVFTQREESIESPANTTVRYQTMTLTLVKDGESWFVDDFMWQ